MLEDGRPTVLKEFLKRKTYSLYISVLKSHECTGQKNKSELKLYTACLPSEVKLNSQANNVKEICYIDALFMVPKSGWPEILTFLKEGLQL